jgi:4-carboxymuconolactone decarboxylase
MAGLPDPLSTLTPEARSVYDKITAKRGQMRGGPFASLMHHPALAEKVGDLGEYLRFGATLPGDIREMAILITARSVNQAYEWVAHARIARTEKLPDDVIERIRTRGDSRRLRRATRSRRASSSTCWRTSRSRRVYKMRSGASSA